MKHIYFKSLVIVIALMLCANIMVAQQEQSDAINITLSDPGSPGSIFVKSQSGTITVIGENRSDVEFIMTSKKQKTKDHKFNKQGLRKIPNQARDVSIVEEDNRIEIRGKSNSRSDFVVKVPTQFAVSVRTHHNGQIDISNVTGEIEANGHHGGIEIRNVSGSVIAGTHHGEITVELNAITNGKAMAFTTYHGDVDVSFPASVKGDIKVKTSKGDLYTDFDIDMQKPRVERKKNSQGQEIKLSDWTYGKIGSGGPELMFNTYHGDIIIRKN